MSSEPNPTGLILLLPNLLGPNPVELILLINFLVKKYHLTKFEFGKK